jgi:hypothetical protein
VMSVMTVMTRVAVEFLLTACTQAPDRLMLASSLTRVAWRSSPHRQRRTIQSGAFLTSTIHLQPRR